MPDLHAILKLPDHAIVTQYALERLGPVTTKQLCEALGKSQPSVYRSLAVLREAGMLKDIRPKPIPKPTKRWSLAHASYLRPA